MINLPRAQNGCTTMVSTAHNVSKEVHRRGCPVISLLQCRETGKLVQNVVYVSQVVQALTTPATFFSVEINSAKEPRPTSCFQQENLNNLKVHLRCKLPKPVKIQCPFCTCGKRKPARWGWQLSQTVSATDTAILCPPTKYRRNSRDTLAMLFHDPQ